jgi:acetyl esterase/lipase
MRIEKMIRNKIYIWQENEYDYKQAYGFKPSIDGYLHEEKTGFAKPCVLVVPGGAYKFVSPSEAELVAEAWFDKGYNVFVLTYSTNNLLTDPLHLQALQDMSRAVRTIRAKADEFAIAVDQIAVCGFSAGGHLCASLAVHHQDIEDENPAFAGVSNRPDAAILSYPVITTGEYTHNESCAALTGAPLDPETGLVDRDSMSAEQQAEMAYMSLENHVTKQTPPCFVWHTMTDDAVPVENAFLFAAACRRAEIVCALHIFSKGKHGLSVATKQWAEMKYKESYTADQMRCIYAAVESKDLEVSDAKLAELGFLSGMNTSPEIIAMFDRKPDEEVAIWPQIADNWLQDLFKNKTQQPL